MFTVLRLIAGLAIAAALAFGIYYVIYTVVINRRIRRGITDKRQLTDMSKIGLIIVIVVLALFSWGQAQFYNSTSYNTRNDFIVVDVSDPDNPQLGMTGNPEMGDVSYVKFLSDDENPGYDKNVVEDGEFTFTVFTRASAADAYHPDFFCFVDYAGELTGGFEVSKLGAFESPEGDARQWSAGSGGTHVDRLLFLGNMDDDCAFVITMSTNKGSSEVRITL